MSRLMLSAVLFCAVPACAWAQQAAPAAAMHDTASVPAAAKQKSHNRFSAVIAELTRAAREQAAAAHATPSGATNANTAPASTAPATPSTAATAAAPVLADSNGR